MATNFLFYFMFVLIVVFLVDMYCFKAITLFTKKMKLFYRTSFYITHWAISAIFLFGLLMVLVFPPTSQNSDGYGKFMMVLSLIYLVYLPRIIFALFHFIDDIIYSIVFITKKIKGNEITSRKLLISKIGLLASTLLLAVVIHGMIWGKFDYQVNAIEIRSNKIPIAFDGYKIALFSDFHAGSVEHQKDKVKLGFQKITNEKPNIILFSGDIVNHFSSELNGWNSVFQELQAPDGKVSILGNHDYGDYIEWPDSIEKQKDRQDMVAFQDSFGFKLLRNEHLVIHHNNDSLYIAGVENYGMPPFKRYGDLNKALMGIDTNACVILLSHEPKHWDEQVKFNPSVLLTLSGHTHAMQFGIDRNGFLWSPAQYFFKRWYGLYCESGSYLYVNRGFGFLAFPGRVGMRPEITIFTLKSIN